MRRLTVTLVTIALLAIGALLVRGCFFAPVAPPFAGGANAGNGISLQQSQVGEGIAVDTGAAIGGADLVQKRSATAVALEYAAERTGYCGRVVSRSGIAVPGITVRLLRIAMDLNLGLGFQVDVLAQEPLHPQLESARAITAADGHFQIDGVMPRGICFLRLEFADVELAPVAFRSGQGTMLPVQRTPVPGEVIDLGDVRLKAGSTAMGRVVDAAGEPVANALVRVARLPPLPNAALPIERLQPDGALIITLPGQVRVIELPEWVGEAMALLPIPMTTSAKDGGFVLNGVDAGDNVLAVTTRGRGSLLRQSLMVAADSVVALGDIALLVDESFDVLVSDAAGEPVASAEVLLAPMSTRAQIHIAERVGRTNAAGRISVAGMPRGSAIAAARRSGSDAFVVGEASAMGRLVTVVLPSACKLVLTIADDKGHTLQPVQLKMLDGVLGSLVMELAVFGFGRGLDLKQRVRVLEDGRNVVDGLRPGRWTLVVGAKGFATQLVRIELLADLDRTITLKPARALRVRVLDGDSAPVVDAAITMESKGGFDAQVQIDMGIAVGRTDSDGFCSVRDLPTDETRLTANHPRFGKVNTVVRGAPAEVTLQFGPPSAIVGVLVDGGRPPAPGRWLIVLKRDYGGSDMPASLEEPQLTVPDLSGAFAFRALQAGEYRVTSQDSAADLGTIASVMAYMGRGKSIIPWSEAKVDLKPGQQAEVRIDALLQSVPVVGPGAVVRGTVTIDGAPGEGAVVVVSSKQPDGNQTSRVDRSGTFDLGRVPAGLVRFVVVPKEVASSRLWENLFSHHFVRDLTVVDGVAQELSIDITTGSVAGVVSDWRGEPVAGCKIVLFDRGGEGRSSALRVERTDASGAFHLGQLPSGKFEVQAQKEGYGLAKSVTLAVTAGSEAAPLLLSLRATAKVVGRVEVRGIQQHAAIGITLTPLDGGDPVRGGALAEGPFELKDVPEGRYRVALQWWLDKVSYAAGELDVIAPRTNDVVLVPQVK